MSGPVYEASISGYPVWRDARRAVEARFVGRGPAGSRAEVLARVEAAPPPLAWAKQIHSSQVLEARIDFCGEGDALVTARAGLALSVITADCVPVLLGAVGAVAAVHAGWRGIAGGVVERAVARLADLGAAAPALTAWIGPAIGPCCYEVGEEVAARVAAASTPAAVAPGASPAGKPLLDLPAAVRHQLAAHGLTDIRALPRCTRCHPDTLHSYRREGKGAGRNLAYIWLRPEG